MRVRAVGVRVVIVRVRAVRVRVMRVLRGAVAVPVVVRVVRRVGVPVIHRAASSHPGESPYQVKQPWGVHKCFSWWNSMGPPPPRNRKCLHT